MSFAVTREEEEAHTAEFIERIKAEGILSIWGPPTGSTKVMVKDAGFGRVALQVTTDHSEGNGVLDRTAAYRLGHLLIAISKSV